MPTTTELPAEVFSPDEYLRDELTERSWTQTEFAEIISRPVQAVLHSYEADAIKTALRFAHLITLAGPNGLPAEIGRGRFVDIDLHPDRVTNLEMGYEELIRRFSELSNETAVTGQLDLACAIADEAS